MQVIVAKYSGFCPGVMQAEDAILATKEKTKEKIYVYGYLIHNQIYIDYLSSLGIETAEDLESVKPGSLLVVRTHGIDRTLEQTLRERYSLLDLTCPKVKRVQKIIQSFAQKGYFIVITGKREHPEVKGLVSYANRFTVIEKEFQIPIEIEQLATEPNLSILIISQTTGDRSLFESTIKAFQEAGSVYRWTIEIHDSICSITALREREALRNLEKVDVTFVVGDKLSSNATKLFNTLRAYTPHVYFISTLKDLNALGLDYSSWRTVQVVSSSSTPAFVEKEIVTYLESL
ncbi:MAG: 4-hydroxy-3-methylbut-2-enyl diphosphate reductase [Spirochaetes bacterium]|nr:4-hydroxy-3-methylbut-2-enyl diphosphate reductase [Spirochaetota bacterium]